MEKNDTLRECQELIYKLSLCESSMPEDIETLLRFAHTQQAKGMREALRMVDEQRAEDSRRWALFRCEVKAQATAREQGHVPYPGWCRQPVQCQGKSSCPLDPTCAD